MFHLWSLGACGAVGAECQMIVLTLLFDSMQLMSAQVPCDEVQPCTSILATIRAMAHRTILNY